MSSFQSEALALRYGNEHCPKGWKVRVWRDLGVWKVNWHQGSIAVLEVKPGRYIAYISGVDPLAYQPDDHPIGFSRSWEVLDESETMEEAVQKAIAAFNEHVRETVSRLGRIQASVLAAHSAAWQDSI